MVSCAIICVIRCLPCSGSGIVRRANDWAVEGRFDVLTGHCSLAKDAGVCRVMVVQPGA